MLKRNWPLFSLLLIEGASLMVVEILGAKLLASFYGSSLYVWTAVLSITVTGLTLGYYVGGRWSRGKVSGKNLGYILMVAAVLVFALPSTARLAIALTKSLSLVPGICVSSILLLVPPMFAFGLVGPLVVRLMADHSPHPGKVGGTVYFTSTLGGIFATFLFGFILTPELGLTASSLITAIALALIALILFLTIHDSRLTNDSRLTGDESRNTVHRSQTSKHRSPITGHRSPISDHRSLITDHSIFFAALEGATVMAVELMAARMLAPYFGASLYVWVAVIGITLLSLAIGYYFGGRVVQQYKGVNTLYWVLMGAAVFLIMMHIVSQQLTLAFAGLDLRVAVVIVSVLLIFPPLVLMGMVPTMLIRQLTSKADGAGSAAGRVFTISSASGLISLPVFGFMIIPAFGLTGPSMMVGLLVGIFPFIKLISSKKYIALVFVVLMMISWSLRNSASSTPDVQIKYYTEGLLGQVLVADVYKNDKGEKTDDRILFVNRMGQTFVDTKTKASKWNYITFASAAASKYPEQSTALVLGLGGGSVANNLSYALKFKVDAVELDARIAQVAKDYFLLNPEVNVIIDDARHYIETTDRKYDLLFFDVFKGDVFPPHVLGVECFEKAKSLLNDNGMIVVNFNGFLTGDIGRAGRCLLKTLQASGFEVKVMPTPGTEEERNTLFFATLPGQQDYQHLRSPLQHDGQPVDMESMFIDLQSLNTPDAIVLNDNHPLLERLNIDAGNVWRKSYNESYTKLLLKNGVPLFK
jgi:predicted membrane-bound spermidine synthase